MTPKTLTFERQLPHNISKVWRALTQGPLLEEWLMQNDFLPIVGHKFQFRATPQPHWDGIVHCEVLTVEPQRELAYAWNSGDLRTTVTWTLTPTETGTLLRMEQAGFRAEDQFNYQGANYGWPKYLDALERVVAGD